MDERQFSNVVSASMRISETAKVEKLRETSTATAQEIIRAKDALFVIYGLRGTGKTTILSEIARSTEASIYLSGDVILKYGVDLFDLLHYAHSAGYKTFMIDEIHAIPDWEKSIKIFYDETHAKIVASGSYAAALRTKGSELSRRARLFEVRPLSFREYLSLKTGKDIPKASLEDLLDPDKRIGLSKSIMPYAGEFEQYLARYGLPVCFFEDKPQAYINIVERVVRYDLEILHGVDAHYVDAAFRIIKMAATSPPGEVSYSKLADSIQRSVKFTKEAVHLLSLAGLFHIVPPEGMGHKAIRSEDKILMPLSFRSALCEAYGVAAPVGALREDFFIQHVKEANYLKTGSERRTPDYSVRGYIFEVGGPTKGWAQLKDRKNAYLVKEALSMERNEIPLYLFGLLY